MDELERLQPPDRAAWRRWLQQHHETSPGVWLVTFKRSSGKSNVTYDDAVEEALCFGWIDGTMRTLDEERTMMLCTRRKRGSGWAKSNKERVDRLIAGGLMMPAGLARIEAAKLDGSWTAFDASEALEMPPDLKRGLSKNKQARGHFDKFPPSAKKQIYYWITSAKRPETREKRVSETVRLAAENVRARG